MARGHAIAGAAPDEGLDAQGAGAGALQRGVRETLVPGEEGEVVEGVAEGAEGGGECGVWGRDGGAVGVCGGGCGGGDQGVEVGCCGVGGRLLRWRSLRGCLGTDLELRGRGCGRARGRSVPDDGAVDVGDGVGFVEAQVVAGEVVEEGVHAEEDELVFEALGVEVDVVQVFELGVSGFGLGLRSSSHGCCGGLGRLRSRGGGRCVVEAGRQDRGLWCGVCCRCCLDFRTGTGSFSGLILLAGWGLWRIRGRR